MRVNLIYNGCSIELTRLSVVVVVWSRDFGFIQSGFESNLKEFKVWFRQIQIATSFTSNLSRQNQQKVNLTSKMTKRPIMEVKQTTD